MQIKTNSNTRSNPAPPHCFYTNRASMRGRMKETNDGFAIIVFAFVILFLAFFSILSVINNDSEVEDEKTKSKTEKFEELFLEFFY